MTTGDGYFVPCCNAPFGAYCEVAFLYLWRVSFHDKLFIIPGSAKILYSMLKIRKQKECPLASCILKRMGWIKMNNQHIGLINIFVILFSISIIIVNIYALINQSISFPRDTITNILFIVIFTLLGIEKIINKNKNGYFYLAFVLVMVIILFVITNVA